MSEGWNTEQLAVRVAEVEVRLAQLSNDLEEVTGLVTGASASDIVPSTPLYATLDAWVGEYFAPTFSRPIGGEIRWCAQWRAHAEAIGRLEALWRSWEALRLDPALGMVMWLTNYLDPQLAALLSRGGPFSQCSPERHETQACLAV